MPVNRVKKLVSSNREREQMYRVKSGKEIEESVKERKKLRKVGKITDA